jgi:hypothetical protein
MSVADLPISVQVAASALSAAKALGAAIDPEA